MRHGARHRATRHGPKRVVASRTTFDMEIICSARLRYDKHHGFNCSRATHCDAKWNQPPECIAQDTALTRKTRPASASQVHKHAVPLCNCPHYGGGFCVIVVIIIFIFLSRKEKENAMGNFSLIFTSPGCSWRCSTKQVTPRFSLFSNLPHDLLSTYRSVSEQRQRLFGPL